MQTDSLEQPKLLDLEAAKILNMESTRILNMESPKLLHTESPKILNLKVRLFEVYWFFCNTKSTTTTSLATLL